MVMAPETVTTRKQSGSRTIASSSVGRLAQAPPAEGRVRDIARTRASTLSAASPGRAAGQGFQAVVVARPVLALVARSLGMAASTLALGRERCELRPDRVTGREQVTRPRHTYAVGLALHVRLAFPASQDGSMPSGAAAPPASPPPPRRPPACSTAPRLRRRAARAPRSSAPADRSRRRSVRRSASAGGPQQGGEGRAGRARAAGRGCAARRSADGGAARSRPDTAAARRSRPRVARPGGLGRGAVVLGARPVGEAARRRLGAQEEVALRPRRRSGWRWRRPAPQRGGQVARSPAPAAVQVEAGASSIAA